MQQLALYLLMFFASGFELTGCNAFWNYFKEQRGGKWALLGLAALSAYGYVQTLQQLSFGRTYATYGGVFILCSLFWGWRKTGVPPDMGDYLGGALCILGSLIIRFWRR